MSTSPGTNAFSVVTAQIQQVWTSQVAQLASVENAIDASGIIGGLEESPVYDISARYNGVRGIYFNVPASKELTGAGVDDDALMTGNHEAPVLSNTQGTVHIRKHAVGLPGEYEQQKTVIDFQQIFINRLKRWVANRRSYDFHQAIGAALTYTDQHNVLYPEGAAAVGDIGETNKLTVDHIMRIKPYADELGIGWVMIPGYGSVRGVLLVSPSAIGDLKMDPDYKELMHQAENRGPSNPLFRNNPFYLTVIDDILILNDRAVPRMYGVTAATHLAQTEHGTFRKVECVFLGASAVGYWQVRPPKSIHPDDRDYGNQIGHGMSLFYGFQPVTINLGTTGSPEVKNLGIIHCPIAATKRAV